MVNCLGYFPATWYLNTETFGKRTSAVHMPLVIHGALGTSCQPACSMAMQYRLEWDLGLIFLSARAGPLGLNLIAFWPCWVIWSCPCGTQSCKTCSASTVLRRKWSKNVGVISQPLFPRALASADTSTTCLTSSLSYAFKSTWRSAKVTPEEAWE